MLNEKSSLIRAGVLLLFIIALLGPWTFDRIHVPGDFTCSAPFIRLNGAFCGVPVSGIEVFNLFVGGFFYMLFELITGAFRGRARELLIGLSILSLMPFFTTLLLIWKKDLPQFRNVNLAAWILALIPALTIFIIQVKDPIVRLWGLWLYILVAISALTVELFLRKEEGKKANKT